MFRSSGFRLAALYTVLFALSGVVIAVAILASARSALSREFDQRIIAEKDALLGEAVREGYVDVHDAMQARDRIPGAMSYGLRSPSGEAIVGALAHSPRPLGWSEDRVGRARVRMYTEVLPTGELATVGDDLQRIVVLDPIILRSFAAALAASILMGAVGGLWLGRRLNSRLSSIAQTAQAIGDGDLSRRAPVRGVGDELDQLATAFNAMLDRMGDLMESLRQVSHDVSHDLRTPLARLRQKLEAGADKPLENQREVMESALTDLDAILETFSAILRISQVEGGARRAAFVPTDLGEIASRVVEAFAPSALEDGRTLELQPKAAAEVIGDAELLTQLLVNLVENALRHTPQGSRIRVAFGLDGRNALLCVTDNGPGIAEAERGRVFDRFYRLETSRTTPGSGLGLSLARAIARLHGGRIILSDADPGLKVRVELPLES